MNASGDTGTTNFDPNFDFYPMRVNGWPSADPLVTSVGGTQLSLDADGKRTDPDVVWNDSDFVGGPFASGGGLSSVFDRPEYQDGVKGVVGNARGTPDISMSSALTGAVWVELSFECGGCGPFVLAAGTSVGTPLFGGIVALADQVAGKPLGQINDALYSIPYGGGLVDVTEGTTTRASRAHRATTPAPATTSRAGSAPSTRCGSFPPLAARGLPGQGVRREGRLLRDDDLRRLPERPAREEGHLVHARRLGRRRRT